MSKSLRSIKDSIERIRIMERRLAGKERGLGYWAAFDAKVRAVPARKGN